MNLFYRKEYIKENKSFGCQCLLSTGPSWWLFHPPVSCDFCVRVFFLGVNFAIRGLVSKVSRCVVGRSLVPGLRSHDDLVIVYYVPVSTFSHPLSSFLILYRPLLFSILYRSLPRTTSTLSSAPFRSSPLPPLHTPRVWQHISSV